MKDDGVILAGGGVRTTAGAASEEAYLIGNRLRAEKSRAVPGQ